MKTFFTLIFSSIFLFTHSQELELDFAHRYGQISDGLEHSVNFTEFYDEYDVWVVAGTFESSVNVGINSNAILTSEDEERMSFVAIYNQDFDLLNHFKLAGDVVSAAYTENEIILTGGFRGIVDFDLEDNDNELIESQSNQSNGFLASFAHQGSLNWVTTFSSFTNNVGVFCSVYNNQILVLNSFAGSDIPFSIIQDGLEVSITSDNGPSTILMRFDLGGVYQFHHNFYSQDSWVIPIDYTRKDNILYLSLRLQSGTFNAGINETLNFDYTGMNNSIVCGFDLNNYELLEYYSFNATNDISGLSGTFIDTNNSSDKILLSSYGLDGTVELSTNMYSEEVTFTATTGISSGFVILIDPNDNVLSSSIFTTDDFVLINDCLLLENGDVMIALAYRTNIFFNNTLVAENYENDDNNSALVYLNAQMNGLAIYEFNSSQGDLNHDLIKESNSNKLVLAGSYRGNHDVDFYETYLGLGNVSDDRAGFLVRYDYDPTVNIEKLEVPKIIIYPNPTSDYLYLDTKFSKEPLIEIYSITGHLVLCSSTISNRINVSCLSPGIYYIKFEELTQQFIVR